MSLRGQYGQGLKKVEDRGRRVASKNVWHPAGQAGRTGMCGMNDALYKNNAENHL
jgi:hypothetical protein